MRYLTTEEKELAEIAEGVFTLNALPMFEDYMFPSISQYVKTPRGKGKPKHFNKKRHGRMLRRKHGRAAK